MVEDPKYLATFAATQPLLGTNVTQLEHLVPWQDYPGPNFGQIEVILENAMEKIAYQGADPAQALKSAENQASALVK